MDERRYSAPAADALLITPLDPFTAFFHRPSGATLLLAEPAPEILAALGEKPLTLAELRDRLLSTYELDDGGALIAERLAELEAAGLITPA